MRAFLNVSRDVVGLSTGEVTLEQAQAKNPDITALVDGAPDGLLVKGEADCSCTFHRLKDGAGGQVLADYDAIEFLDFIKTSRCLEIDARTTELCLAGYYHQPIDTWFSTSEHAQLNWASLRTMKEYIQYPVKMPTRALDGGNYSCPDVETYEAICLGMLAHRAGIVTEGQDIKESIRLAETKAAVDAIVDPR